MLKTILDLLQNYGTIGIFILSTIEAIFFPLPPETLLIPAVIVNPANMLVNVVMATLASTLGSIFGYLIGNRGGRLLLNKFFAQNRIKRVEDLFGHYGITAIMISAITPIPYKVFTIAAGAFKMRLSQLIYASLLGRGLRFLTVGLLTFYLGRQVWVYLKSPFINLSIIGILVTLSIIYFLVRSKINRVDLKEGEKSGLRRRNNRNGKES